MTEPHAAPTWLDRIVVVLWQPQDPVNIAASIRAMKNFGLRRLRLVAPAVWEPWRIEGIAHGTQDVVAATELFPTLDDAVADCSFVLGTTARPRRAKRTVYRPRHAAAVVRARAEADEAPVALVFGREDIGLTNEALDRCHALLTIPTNPAYPSLNLAQAVLLVVYEVWMATGAEETPVRPPRRVAPPATAAELEETLHAIQTALERIDFFRAHHPDTAMRTVRELVYRANLDAREAGFVRAMAYETVHALDRATSSRS